MRRHRRFSLWLGSAGSLAALGIGIAVLWWYHVIALPPVVIRGAGRVAGLMTVRGSMDVQLPVPYYRQEHALSCEVAALRMALGAVGVPASEDELLRALPSDPTPRSAGVWGDPHEGFVGDIDGRMLVTGYGVYAAPIARIGRRWKRTEVLQDSSIAEVAAHVEAGRPVIVWGYYGRPIRQMWRTPSGRIIGAVNGEHTRVVTGFRGTAEAPTHFSLSDPLYGRLVWTTETFERNWDALGRMAVVVYQAAGEEG